MSRLPLEGIRVIELGTHVVVPTATRLLADWGAEVIKIENPSGDEYRKIGAAYSTPITDDENPLFFLANMNKKMVSLDLKTEGGMSVFLKLIENADVFASSVRLQGLERMGVSYERLKAINPRLIYLHFSGFGYNGPDAKRPGFDVTAFWARSGALIDSAVEGGFPAKQSMGLGDSALSSILASGVTTALYGREKTGEGCFLTSSLYGGAIWYNSTSIVTAQKAYGASYPKNQFAPGNPLAYFYKCKDGEWLCIASAGYDHNYAKAMVAFDLEELVNDPRYSTLAECNKRLPEFTAILNDKFATMDRADWCTRLATYGMAYEKLVHYKDVADDPQVWANDFMSYMNFASGNRVALPNPPLQFKEYDTSRRQKPGGIGADTSEILEKVGYSKEEIQALAQEKSVIVAH